MSRLTLCNGTTADGHHVLAVQTGDHPLDVEIVIDGEAAPLTERPRVYRDGGTREFHTERGVVRFPRRMNSDDRTPRLDGERIQSACP